jgi:hypothetical protein
LAKLMLADGFQQNAEDHRGACGGGYLTAVCPKRVCP